ncbi:hypothetical protein ACFL96_04900 [Thermoproteota archaeon]
MTREPKHICRSCGFDGLKEEPYIGQKDPSFEICPCCGFEFGVDDILGEGHYASFRNQWIENGADWFMPERRPKKWNLDKQLSNLSQIDKKPS